MDIVIHHLHWVELDLVVMGYLSGTASEPSLALLRVGRDAAGAVCSRLTVECDLEERVCSYDDDFVSAPRSHRYLTTYIKQW